MTEANIRTARPKDMTKVYDLIKELAIYEKAEHELTNTIEQLIKDGFGPTKVFDCLVAEIKDEIIGFALYYTSYSTWKGSCIYLEDFLVTKKVRGKGVGTLLFNEILSIAKLKKVGRLEWQILDWNEPALNFYRKYDSILDENWINGKITFN